MAGVKEMGTGWDELEGSRWTGWTIWQSSKLKEGIDLTLRNEMMDDFVDTLLAIREKYNLCNERL